MLSKVQMRTQGARIYLLLVLSPCIHGTKETRRGMMTKLSLGYGRPLWPTYCSFRVTTKERGQKI